MKLSKLIFASVLAIAIAGPVWSQSANRVASPGILGYLNPGINSFRPLYIQPAPVRAAVSVATGKITVNLKISLPSSFPTRSPISCGATAFVDDINKKTVITSNDISESASAVGTHEGATATCSVAIPYSWPLVNRSTDTVALGFSVNVSSNSTTPGVTSRSNSQSLGSITIPANRTTTVRNVNVTL
jgi:hypothetical protein